MITLELAKTLPPSSPSRSLAIRCTLVAASSRERVYISSRNQYHHASAGSRAAASMCCARNACDELKRCVDMVRACSAPRGIRDHHHLRNSATIRAMREWSRAAGSVRR